LIVFPWKYFLMIIDKWSSVWKWVAFWSVAIFQTVYGYQGQGWFPNDFKFLLNVLIVLISQGRMGTNSTTSPILTGSITWKVHMITRAWRWVFRWPDTPGDMVVCIYDPQNKSRLGAIWGLSTAHRRHTYIHTYIESIFTLQYIKVPIINNSRGSEGYILDQFRIVNRQPC
jgi:hypothetical protein